MRVSGPISPNPLITLGDCSLVIISGISVAFPFRAPSTSAFFIFFVAAPQTRNLKRQHIESMIQRQFIVFRGALRHNDPLFRLPGQRELTRRRVMY